jgi:TonB-dependent receptor
MIHPFGWRNLAAIVLFCLCVPCGLFCQAQTASISGHVTDASSAVIQSARVVVTPGNFVTTSNEQGDFSVTGLAAGTYTVTVTLEGFSPSTQSVNLTAGQTEKVNAILQVGSSTEEVVVSAATGQNMTEAVNEEITSPNIVNVMPETEIIALPNANIADAVGRMPGVTLQRDEGEGVYVQVRGLDPRLTNVTIDGVTTPAPEVAIRQVNLATIPDDMVQSIELNKTLSANQDADGIGGSVNLVTKMAGEQPTFTLETTMGYTPIENTRYMGKVDTTAGMRFGAAKRWGAILGAEYDYNGRGINDIEPDPQPNPDGSSTPYYDKVTLREYRYSRLRWGGTSTVDYKMSDHTSFAAHFMLSDFKDWGDKWYYEIKTDKPSGASFYESLRRPDLAVGTFSLDGNHVYKNVWVHWGSAVSRSRELNSGGNPEIDWAPTSAALNQPGALTPSGDPVPTQPGSTVIPSCDYVGTPKNQYLPQWDSACMVATSPMYNLNNYAMTQFITTTGQAVELNLQEWAGVGLSYHLGSHPATLEVGGEFRNSHAFQYAYTPTYIPSFDNNSNGGDSNGNPYGIYASQFQSGFQDPDYYSGNYHNGPFTNYYKQYGYFSANPSQFVLNQALTHFGSDSNNFDLIERISGGYVMNTIDWSRFRLQAGLRFEATQVRALGYTVNPVAGPYGNGTDSPTGNGNWIGTTPTSTTESYIDPLPSVQARWQVSTLTAIRAVYARGISRPNPYDLVPYLLDNGAGSVPRYAIGNPNEQPTHANNFDVLLEQELRPFGVIQAGYFYKQLIDPIVSVYVPYTTINPDGSPDLAAQNINAANASVYGLEFSWQQRLTSLPGALRGLGMMANYAYTGSHTNGILGRTDSPPLIGQAKHAFNIEPAYELGRYSAHVGISYNGANDNAYQYFNNQADPSNDTAGPPNGPLGDNYFFPHLQVDAQVGARLFRGLSLHFDGLNLNNEVFGFYNGSPQYMTQREYYKPTYSASLRWDSSREH